jgi:hypothetical protein
MAYRVAWSPRAVEDLEAIAQYIAADSAAYAAAVAAAGSKDDSHHCTQPLTFPPLGSRSS